MAEDGQIQGLTLQGKDLVDILGLDLEGARGVRVKYMGLLALHRRYPDDSEVKALCQQEFGFPDDLPDLIKLRPPGNTRREGAEKSYHRQRAELYRRAGTEAAGGTSDGGTGRPNDPAAE